MKKIILSAVIIDDEESAIIVLAELLIAFSSIRIVGTATNLDDGIKLIKETQPEIVFLDVNMPFRNGFEIYTEFKSPDFKIIFCSASDKYAVEALSMNASGYLLKPIDIVELQDSLEKVYDEFYQDLKQLELEDQQGALTTPELSGENILLEVDHGFIIGNTNNIKYCYAKNSYSIVVMNSKKEFLIPKSLKELLEILPYNQFYRTHKSFLVNIFYIQKFVRGDENFVLLEGGVKIPVSVRITTVISKDIKNKMDNLKKSLKKRISPKFENQYIKNKV